MDDVKYDYLRLYSIDTKSRLVELWQVAHTSSLVESLKLCHIQFGSVYRDILWPHVTFYAERLSELETVLVCWKSVETSRRKVESLLDKSNKCWVGLQFVEYIF